MHGLGKHEIHLEVFKSTYKETHAIGQSPKGGLILFAELNRPEFRGGQFV